MKEDECMPCVMCVQDAVGNWRCGADWKGREIGSIAICPQRETRDLLEKVRSG